MNPTVILDRRSVVLASILLAAMIVLDGGLALFVLSDPGLEYAFHMAKVARLADEHSYREVDWERHVRAGRDAMLDMLDRYSGYVPPAEFQEKERQREGHYVGIGATVSSHEDGLRVYSVRDDGPGKAAGLLSGDIIIAADTNRLDGLSAAEATAFLRGEDGTTVVLHVYRPAIGDSLDIEVVRRAVTYRHVVYAGYTPDSVLYIRLGDFAPGASDEVGAALDSLAPRDGPARGVILDLRGNPGGLFVEARATAGLFLDDGAFVVGTDGRSRWNNESFTADGFDHTHGLPLALLVDHASASASEIVAGALRQNDRAVLVGDTTFGKGLVQGYLRFLDGDGLRLTISRYFFEGGLYLNEFDSMLHETGRGLAPDFFYRAPDLEDYLRVLENSFLLQSFAHLHQDELISHGAAGQLNDIWIEKLVEYIEDDLDFPSELTNRAQALVGASKQEGASPAAAVAAEELLSLAREHDRLRPFKYHNFLKTRLRQLAFERAFSAYRAFDEVVVNEDPAIAFAAEQIAGR